MNLNLNPVSVEGSKGSTIFLFTESNPELRLMIGSDASLVGLEKNPTVRLGIVKLMYLNIIFRWKYRTNLCLAT